MQGNNRAKLHIFFHLTTQNRNYYFFLDKKNVFYPDQTLCAQKKLSLPNPN